MTGVIETTSNGAGEFARLQVTPPKVQPVKFYVDHCLLFQRSTKSLARQGWHPGFVCVEKSLSISALIANINDLTSSIFHRLDVAIQWNGVYKILLTKILSGYFFAGTRTSGGYPTSVYIILLNIATKLELQKATHGAKLELLEATLVNLTNAVAL